MSEFPALRDALVAAGLRRRRRRRAVGATIPTLAVAAAAAFVVLPAGQRDREDAAPAPRDALEQAYAVFRRPQRASDRLPARGTVPGNIDEARTRRLGQIGPTSFFAVPTTENGRALLCLLAHRKGGSSTARGPAAVDERHPRGLLAAGAHVAGDATVYLFPDGTRDVRWILRAGRGMTGLRNNASMVMTTAPLLGVSWTAASGTRYVERRRASGAAHPGGCPKRPGALPDDTLEKARRAALIAVDEYYPRATEATAGDAVRSTRCGGRSVEVALRLVPGGEGRLLIGIQDGYARVFDVLR